MEIKRAGSQPSTKGSAEYFTGAVRFDPLVEAPSRRASSAERHLRARRAHGLAHPSARPDANRDRRLRAAFNARAARARRSVRATSSGSRRARSTGTAPRRPRR